MESFDRVGFNQYLWQNFDAYNHFTDDMVNNIIDYGIKNQNVSCDQLAEFLEDMIPEVSFEEILIFFDDTVLTNSSRIQKYNYILNTHARKLEPKEVYPVAKLLMDPEDIDHHGLGTGMDDLYLRKNEVSAKIYNALKNNSMVTTFVDQIDHDTWYEYPFLYPVVTEE